LEYGPQSWASLREGLRGHNQETFALAQAEFVNDPHHDGTDTAEIQDVMARLRMDEWRKQSTVLAEQADHDPQAMARLKALNERMAQYRAT
jgi:DNA primase